MKPTLSVNKNYLYVNSFNTLGVEMLRYVVESGLFDITYHEEHLQVGKGERGTIVYYNGKKVYVDFWEYLWPTYSKETWDAQFDLIIKLQHYNFTPEYFEQRCPRKNVMMFLTKEQRGDFIKKIVPWTFFCSRMIRQFIGKEDQLEPIPVDKLGFFCGKLWKCRIAMKDKFDKEGVEYTRSSQEWKSQRPLTDEEYIQKMRSSKFGISMAGRRSWFTEAKNRREVDYMMLKKPLLLNYKPFYYDPLIEGKHYVYFDVNTNLKEIESKYNIDEIAMNGYEWYKNNASPTGCAKSFLKIMQDRFDEKIKV